MVNDMTCSVQYVNTFSNKIIFTAWHKC